MQNFTNLSSAELALRVLNAKFGTICFRLITVCPVNKMKPYFLFMLPKYAILGLKLESQFNESHSELYMGCTSEKVSSGCADSEGQDQTAHACAQSDLGLRCPLTESLDTMNRMYMYEWSPKV